MLVSILSAAKRLGSHSGWALSNLTMQKIAYLAHMFHLGKIDEPLVSGHFEAWDYGPVHPQLYNAVKMFGSGSVESYVFNKVPEMEECIGTQYLDTLTEKFGEKPSELISITHWEKGAWAKYYSPGLRGIIIPNKAIKDEYRERVGKS